MPKSSKAAPRLPASVEEAPGNARIWWIAGLVALLLCFFLVARRMPAAYGPAPTYGDAASLEVAVLEAAEEWRLVGQPTRFGFHQLGPSHFYLSVPGYLATQRAQWSITATHWLLALSSFGAIAWILGRFVLSRWVLGAIAVIAIPFMMYLEVPTVMALWGQYEIVLPFAALLAASAAVACGRTSYAWLVALLASYVIQGYGSTLPAVAAIVLSAGVGAWLHRGAGAARRWHAWSTLAVLAALWLPTAVDAVVSSPSNLRRVAYHYSHRAEAPLNPLVTDSLSVHLSGPWLGLSGLRQVRAWPLGPTLTRWSHPLAATWVVLVIAATVTAWRRRRHYVAALSGLCLLTAALAWLSGRRLDGDPYPYVFLWIASAGALGWGVASGELLSVAFRERAQGLGAAKALAFGALGALALVVIRPPRVPVPGDPAIDLLEARVLAASPDPTRPIHFRAHGQSWIWVVGAMIELHNRGLQVSIENVQKGQSIPDLQGLMPRWLARRPQSRVLAFHLEGEGGAATDEILLGCEAIRPIVGFSRICVYDVPDSGQQGATHVTH